MKTNFFKLMAAVMVCAVSMLMASCCDDDDEPVKDPITNSNAGEFCVKNLRTGSLFSIVVREGEMPKVTTDGTIDASIWVGDTLIISFVPDKQFSDLKFEFKHLCDGKEIGDTIFTKYLSIGSHYLALNASYKDSNYDLSAGKVATFDVERGIEVKDYSSGTFEVMSLSAYETIEQSAEVIDGDTLLIRFTPKQDYHNYSFSVSCKDLKKVNDSIFVVPRMNSGIHEVEFVASDTIGKDIYQATKTLTLNVPKSYVIIPMKVNVSADLKPFVDVELSYTDKDGNERKYLIKEEEWIKPDIKSFYEYKTEEGEIEYGFSVPEGCEIINAEAYAPDCYYVLNTRFLDLENDVTTTFSARYIPKPDIEIDKGNYTFSHSIDRMSANISIPGRIVIDNYMSISISIDIIIGESNPEEPNPEETKINVMSYLEELSNNPDIKKFNISTTGSITSVE